MDDNDKKAVYEMVKSTLHWWQRYWYKNDRLYNPTWEDIEGEEDISIDKKEQLEDVAWHFMYLFEAITFEEFVMMLKRMDIESEQEQS